MNLVFVSEYFPYSEKGELRGGAEARTFFIVRELARRHTITVLASRERENDDRQTLFDSVTVERCGGLHHFAQAGSLASRWKLFHTFRRRIAVMRGDIVDAQNFLAYVPVWLSARNFSAKVITVHDVWHGRWVKLFGISGIVGELYERYALSRPWGGFIANSRQTAQRLEREAHAEASRIRVVYNGISASPNASPTLYDHPTVTYVGRLVEYKRVQDLIAAFSLLVKTIPDARLHIIGVGPYEEQLREIVRLQHLHGAVSFLGHIESHADVLDAIARSHVFSLPSVIEGFGMVTLEAMSLGTPFVNADIPVTREMTADNGGLFFRPKDVPTLARQLQTILGNTAMRQKLGKEGRERAKQFHWDSLGVQTERCYREILERRSLG